MRGPIPRVHMQGFFWYMDGVVVVYSMKTEMEEKNEEILSKWFLKNLKK